MTITVGSVSHATMREEDLIPAFINSLFYIDRSASSGFNQEWEELQKVTEWVEERFTWQQLREDNLIWARIVDDQHNLLESLFDTLDSHAPEGYYFGAHPGDGSDYGYWENEEEFELD